jgi:hypothetical protein
VGLFKSIDGVGEFLYDRRMSASTPGPLKIESAVPSSHRQLVTLILRAVTQEAIILSVAVVETSNLAKQ